LYLCFYFSGVVVADGWSKIKEFGGQGIWYLVVKEFGGQVKRSRNLVQDQGIWWSPFLSPKPFLIGHCFNQ